MEVFYKKCVLKSFAIFTAKHLCLSLFLSCNFINKDSLAQEFSCEFCKIFKDTFFTEHLWMTPLNLQQLRALYFAIVYSWLLLSNKKSLVGKKIIHISQGFPFFIFILPFFHFLRQMSVYLVSYAKRMSYSEQPNVLLSRRHLNTKILTNFENINSISNTFQETHDFLVLTDPQSFS